LNLLRRFIEQFNRPSVQLLELIAEAQRLKHMARQRKTVDDMQLCPPLDIVCVDPANHVAMITHRERTPALARKGHAASFQFGTQGAIHEHELPAADASHKISCLVCRHLSRLNHWPQALVYSINRVTGKSRGKFRP
jgi:hypothetical protein